MFTPEVAIPQEVSILSPLFLKAEPVGIFASADLLILHIKLSKSLYSMPTLEFGFISGFGIQLL